MYSIRRDENIIPDLEMMKRVINKLNNQFDPTEMYHHSSASSEMFEFHLEFDNDRREAWVITFLGHVVTGGSEFGLDYSECQEEEYVTLETENETKIFMAAVNGAIEYINNFVNLVALSDLSSQSKQKWITMLERGMK